MSTKALRAEIAKGPRHAAMQVAEVQALSAPPHAVFTVDLYLSCEVPAGAKSGSCSWQTK